MTSQIYSDTNSNCIQFCLIPHTDMWSRTIFKISRGLTLVTVKENLGGGDRGTRTALSTDSVSP